MNEILPSPHNIFSGNFDRYTVVRHDLDEAVITRYIRIHPETWHGHISMRAEFYGCRTGFDIPVQECMSPLGMKSKEIPDEAITATTVLSQYHGPERARLDAVIEGSYTGGWVSLYIDLGQWVQVDLGNITKITAVATQGHHELLHWVTEYYLSYSVNGGPFLSYNDNQILFGNIDRDTVIGHILDPPLITRYIRLHPKTWYTRIAMRFELYGCRSGFPAPEVPPCQIQLGMQNKQIPDSSLSASSVLTIADGYQNGRLHLQAGGGLMGAWIPAINDANPWLQVDFNAERQVTAIATQGRENGDYWVMTYTLSYSSDGNNYTHYQQEGVTKTFTGNTDGYSVVTHMLDPPMNSQYLRVHPQSWNNQIALRVEFYGC
ncbi:lactadherin-like [Oculina patagonica]